MDSEYSKNELGEILEKIRKKYLSKVDHSNGTKGCTCNMELINTNTNYINDIYINNNYINNNYINNNYIINNYINNNYVYCSV